MKDTLTSFSDVMTVKNIDSRTFFHLRGANDEWNAANLDFKTNPAKILHLGYLLLLKQMDAPDDKFCTKACKLLYEAQQQGIKTCIDTVTIYEADLFKKTVIPALKYVNYCILNEIEAQNITDVQLRDKNEKIIPENLAAAADKILSHGVQELVVIHFADGSFAKT